MKKVLVAFAGNRYSQSAFDFIKALNRAQPLLATGLFLPEYDLSRIWVFSDPVSGQSYIPDIDTVRDGRKVNPRKKFEDFCETEGIRYKMHMDTGQITVKAIIEESRFADLLIINNEKFYEYMGSDASNPTLKDALHRSECPVLVLPEKILPPERIILAYDGSASSVYAIKQFAYLFPQWKEMETMLVYADKDPEAGIPHEEYIKEFVSLHFSHVQYYKADAVRENLFGRLSAHERKTLVVTGSFGRSSASQLLRRSFAADLLSKHQLPVFISHC